MVVEDGKIAFVGAKDEALARKGPSTVVRDLEGKTMLPGFVDGGTGLDAYLWVKPPAESDGTCNEGPPAGEVYLDQAVELARAAGW